MVSQRLSNDIIPANYKITIKPDLKNFTYEGSVEITTVIKKPTNLITLHSKNLKIKNATVCVGTQCLLPKIKINGKLEQLTLITANKIIPQNVEIHIDFAGEITDSLVGIYRSKYEYEGKAKYMLTTQCEAPYARRIFPCFDEPDKKSTFDLTVEIEKELQAISNMPIKTESTQNNKKTIQFKTTPKMPTYLFYIGIGDFEFLEDNYNDVKIRVVTTPGKIQRGKFALEHAKKYLEYFEKYSEIPYPLEKLDLIAVPDFQSGAMENWGAITFRELVLLIDEEKSSARIKKRVAEIIAHELWHQWSGNLVTMKWWNDLWLNESFANYMAYKAVDHFAPEWKTWEDYISSELFRGLFKDTLKTTHPIEIEVNSPDEIEEIFDDISYAKGGSVLRMLEAYVGEEQFRLGVSNYLKKHTYENAEAHDLWHAIAEATSNNSIKHIMKSWISQPGYPLIEIKQKKDKITITQKRCNKKTNQIWPIPISIATNEICYNKMLEKSSQQYEIKSRYLKLNHDQYGFYRTKYPKQILRNLGELIEKNKFSAIDRYGIHNDLWVLCLIRQEKIEEYISLLNSYSKENSFIILADIANNIRKLERLCIHKSWWPNAKRKITSIILPAYKKILKEIGWIQQPEESTETIMLRSLAIGFCGFAEDKETIMEAQAKYAKNEINTNIADAVYYIVARNGAESEFKEMLSSYLNEKDLELKIKLLVGLYQFKQPKIIKEALDLALTEKVRFQDLRYIFQNLPANPQAGETIQKWFEKNFPILKKYEDSHYIFEDLLNALIVTQTNKKYLRKISKFLKTNKVQYERTKANAFEIANMNINFINKNKKFLEKQ
ncbi:MAG: M1 family metallopeptidase [Nanoarchaeota archaeon]